jgi:hypothetical protein
MKGKHSKAWHEWRTIKKLRLYQSHGHRLISCPKVANRLREFGVMAHADPCCPAHHVFFTPNDWFVWAPK